MDNITNSEIEELDLYYSNNTNNIIAKQESTKSLLSSNSNNSIKKQNIKSQIFNEICLFFNCSKKE